MLTINIFEILIYTAKKLKFSKAVFILIKINNLLSLTVSYLRSTLNIFEIHCRFAHCTRQTGFLSNFLLLPSALFTQSEKGFKNCSCRKS